MEQHRYALNKVMVIDDSPIEHFVVRRIMDVHHFAGTLIQCMNGADGIQYLKKCISLPHDLPQLILLDINMEEMNGYEFMEAFTMLPPIVSSNCKIVIFSSSVLAEDKQAFQKFDAVVAYIEKPLTSEKLNCLKRSLGLPL